MDKLIKRTSLSKKVKYLNDQKLIAFSFTFGCTILLTSSVVQATDLQIYAAPSAGQKTIVMMLDTSGSMGSMRSPTDRDGNFLGGYSYVDDYGLTTCGTSSQTALASLVTSILGLTNNTAYRVSSGTTPSYDRNFCYVSANSAKGNDLITNSVSGCNPQKGTTGNITGYQCFDRLTRLKDGMFILLDSTDEEARKLLQNSSSSTANLSSTYIGVGNFSSKGDSKSGQILVPAKLLGPVGSDQRVALKTAIANLSAYQGTPSAPAFAEAASYLMGTSTYIYRTVKIMRDTVQMWGDSSTRATSKNSSWSNTCPNQYEHKFYYKVRACSRWNDIYSTSDGTAKETCDWGSSSTKAISVCSSSSTLPAWPNNYAESQFVGSYDWNETSYYGTYYNKVTANDDSGISYSKENDKTNSGIVVNNLVSDADALYKSPLPSDAKKASCDGQGIYFLSDGAANNSSDTKALTVMQKTLDTKGSLFSCSSILSNTLDASGNDAGSGWQCMGAFAKSLFNPVTNPKGRSIQTAFVGFGSMFFTNNITSSNQDTKNACRLSSRAYKDAATGAEPNDKCSPNFGGSLAVPKPTENTSGTGRGDGYNYDGGLGNGGFFQASSASDVTRSVVEFINSLGATPPDPLSTGAVSVPVDALNPNGFQPYGYLRALKPDPGKNYLIWQGNLKKYGITGGALKDGTVTVFNELGALNKNTKDLWNASNSADLGLVENGGVYSKLSLPTIANPNTFRPLFTDVSSASNGNLVKMSVKNSNLLAVTNRPIADSVALLDKFNTQTTVKDFSPLLKIKLLNYLGYDLNLSTTTSLPTSLTSPNLPFTAMGGSIHSLPVQLTYSGDLDEYGDLTSARSQSVLYSSMEGGLRIVDAVTGTEQMVFVPADILLNDDASRALRRSESGGATYGIDGTWVADAAYEFGEGATAGTMSVKAKQMNVYGGMRMGGNSFYGLNVLDPKNPKFLFRIGPDLGGKYARMGQSWSKPVITNVRYGDKIKRVMIIGGGYDICYENPRFKLNTANPTEYGGPACKKNQADGNAVYIIDATDGTILWSISNAGADTNVASMTHSIVSRISALDRDGDGLVDHLYFGDLGGQVFRADLNNTKGTTTSAFGKRVVRLANLGSTTISAGDQPRFYQAPTLTKHTQGADTFILVGIASGDRSTPLDVSPLTGREGILPTNALTNRPTNNVYGLIDRDFSNKDLMTIGDSDLKTVDLTLSNLKKNPQSLSGTISSNFFPYNKTTGLQGWYRSLSSDPTGNDVSGRTLGGMKALEDGPIALTNYLYVPVYDPEGTGIVQQDPCKPRIVGETNTQQFCLPYGVCLKLDGSKDETEERKTGFQIANGKNLNISGAGIRGITLGPDDPDPNPNPKKNSCGSLTMVGNLKGSGKWECTRILNPVRWYEKYVSAN